MFFDVVIILFSVKKGLQGNRRNCMEEEQLRKEVQDIFNAKYCTFLNSISCITCQIYIIAVILNLTIRLYICDNV